MARMKAARYGLKTPPHHTTWPELLTIWELADQQEGAFESIWNWDHFYPLAPPFDGPNLEAWTMLGAMAQATSRIRIGAMVNGMHHRHPALTANMAATLDHIAEGRFILGMGAGWNEMESSAYGLDLGTPSERSDRFEEGMEVIASLLANEETSLSGGFYRLERARCEPKPIQAHIPIVIGGKGRRRTLRTAARFADQWDMTFPESPEEWVELNGVLEAHCDAVERDSAEIDRSIHLPFAPESSPVHMLRDAAPFFEAGVDIVVWSWRGPLDPRRLEDLASTISRS